MLIDIVSIPCDLVTLVPGLPLVSLDSVNLGHEEDAVCLPRKIGFGHYCNAALKMDKAVNR